MTEHARYRWLKPGRLHRFKRSLVVGLATAICGLILASTPQGAAFEGKFGLHWLFKMRGSIQPPPEVVVVGINGTTGKALKLPALPHHWPRSIHAKLIERLTEQNAKVIVFDIDFSRAKPGDEDAIFARAIAASGRVVLFEGLTARSAGYEASHSVEGVGHGWIWIEERQPPAPALAAVAKAIGPFPVPKGDQAAAEFWAFKPSVGDAPTAAAVALQQNALSVYEEWLALLRLAQASGLDALPKHVGELSKPADMQKLMQHLRRTFQEDPFLQKRVERELDSLYSEASESRERRLLSALTALYAGPDNYFFNFYGPPGTIHIIPYETLVADVSARNTLRGDELANSVVFVGYSDLTAPSSPDRFFTSFTTKDGVDLSGVEILATAYANLLSQRAVRPSSMLVLVLSIISFGFIVGILAHSLPATAALPFAIAFAGLYAGIVQWSFNEMDVWLPLATPVLVQLPLALITGFMGQYLLERRIEKRISRTLCHYIPENLVRDLVESEVDPTTVNRVVFGTCLATDMSGFTGLAETKPPRELAKLMNEYFESLAQALTRHSVDVMEFRADMIMCAWISQDSSSVKGVNGVAAAIEVSEAILKFAKEHRLPSIKPRVGIEAGSVYVGHTGGGGHFVYSIQGDAANTAARLESLNKHLGTRVLAAEPVVHNAEGLLLRPLGLFRLGGKSEPTSIVEILGRKDRAKREQVELCSQFAEGLAAFQQQDWTLSASVFEAITKGTADDGPSWFYLSISRRYAKEMTIHDGPITIQMDQKVMTLRPN